MPKPVTVVLAGTYAACEEVLRAAFPNGKPPKYVFVSTGRHAERLRGLRNVEVLALRDWDYDVTPRQRDYIAATLNECHVVRTIHGDTPEDFRHRRDGQAEVRQAECPRCGAVRVASQRDFPDRWKCGSARARDGAFQRSRTCEFWSDDE